MLQIEIVDQNMMKIMFFININMTHQITNTKATIKNSK